MSIILSKSFYLVIYIFSILNTFVLFILLVVISFFVWQNDRDSAIVEEKMGNWHESRKCSSSNDTKVQFSFYLEAFSLSIYLVLFINGYMFHVLNRSGNDVNKSGPSHENGIQYGPENNLVATSDSCSSDADYKSYTSDSPHLAITNGETSKR